MTSRRGFTLIELLVVIAIIAIIAAILFPVFAQARAKARQATCQTHMKQVTLAWGMYCQDYDEQTPGFTGGFCPGSKVDPGWACLILPLTPPPVWFPDPTKALLWPYLKNAESAKCSVAGPNVWGLANLGPYGYNHFFLVWGGKKRGNFNPVTMGTSYVQLSMIGSPAETICWLDYTDMLVYPPPNPETRTIAYPPAFSGQALSGTLGARHNLGWNVSMVDGHVKWYRDPSDISASIRLWDLE